MSARMQQVHCSFYLRKGTVYVPTMAKTRSGYWLATEPVDVVRVEDAEALKAVLLKVIARGNPVVPTPSRKHYPPDVMRRYCGMRSFSAFEQTAQLWQISQSMDSYVILPMRRSETYRGAWEGNREQETIVPLDADIEDVVAAAAYLAFSVAS